MNVVLNLYEWLVLGNQEVVWLNILNWRDKQDIHHRGFLSWARTHWCTVDDSRRVVLVYVLMHRHDQ